MFRELFLYFVTYPFLQEKQLRCKVEGMFVEARRTEVVLAALNKNAPHNRQGVPLQQAWELQSQRPGSGVLDVECLHRGPTLVIFLSISFKNCRTYFDIFPTS